MSAERALEGKSLFMHRRQARIREQLRDGILEVQEREAVIERDKRTHSIRQYLMINEVEALLEHIDALEERLNGGAKGGGRSMSVDDNLKGHAMTDTRALYAREKEVRALAKVLEDDGCEEPALTLALGNYRRVLAERDQWREFVAEVAALVNPGGFRSGPWAKVEIDTESGLFAFIASSEIVPLYDADLNRIEA